MEKLNKNLFRLVLYLIALLHLFTIIGCESSDGESQDEAVEEGRGGDEDGKEDGKGGDGADNGSEENGSLDICPDQDPPFENPNCINLLCPPIEPVEGKRAPKGACCFRTSNEEKTENAKPGETIDFAFAVAGMKIITQTSTLGSEAITQVIQELRDSGTGLQLIIRFSNIPREEDATGPVDVEVSYGPGRPNCDGTYSFYGKGAAASMEGRTDSDRWMPLTARGTFDWDRNPYLQIDSEGFTGGLSWVPIWSGHTVEDLFYEQPVRKIGLNIPNNDSFDEEQNCIGYLDKYEQWHGKPMVSIFLPMEQADQTIIELAGNTLCSVIANGVGDFDCESPRVGGPNPWHELPDGYCDENDCWIGDQNHPDADCGSDEKPCCDPTAESTEAPACNAWFVQLEFVAGSVTTKVDEDGELIYIENSEDSPPPICN